MRSMTPGASSHFTGCTILSCTCLAAQTAFFSFLETLLRSQSQAVALSSSLAFAAVRHFRPGLPVFFLSFRVQLSRATIQIHRKDLHKSFVLACPCFCWPASASAHGIDKGYGPASASIQPCCWRTVRWKLPL